MLDSVDIFRAKHYLTDEARLKQSLIDIEEELAGYIKFFEDREMFVEAQRTEQRTNFGVEMIRKIE